MPLRSEKSVARERDPLLLAFCFAVNEQDSKVLAASIAARDEVDYEACHCTLRSLYLGNNVLRTQGAQIISAALPRNYLISRLCVVCNSIGDLGANAILSASKNRSCLTMLSLAENAIGDKGLVQLPFLLESCPGLRELHLNGNVIGDEGAHSIAHGLVLTRSLQVLNLNGNRIRDDGVKQIALALDGKCFICCRFDD